MNLASALGAKTIRLESFYIKESGGFGSKVKPNILAQQIGINARFDSKGQLEKIFIKNLTSQNFRHMFLMKYNNGLKLIRIFANWQKTDSQITCQILMLS